MNKMCSISSTVLPKLNSYHTRRLKITTKQQKEQIFKKANVSGQSCSNLPLSASLQSGSKTQGDIKVGENVSKVNFGTFNSQAG